MDDKRQPYSCTLFPKQSCKVISRLVYYLIKLCVIPQINISIDGSTVLEDKMVVLRDIWEETSFQLERLQTNPDCVCQEQEGLSKRRDPAYHVPFEPDRVHIVPEGKLSLFGYKTFFHSQDKNDPKYLSQSYKILLQDFFPTKSIPKPRSIL